MYTNLGLNCIDVLSYWVWRCITSFIDHAIQIYVEQKDNANQWKVTVLEEFLHTVLLYQVRSRCQRYKCFSCTLTILHRH